MRNQLTTTTKWSPSVRRGIAKDRETVHRQIGDNDIIIRTLKTIAQVRERERGGGGGGEREREKGIASLILCSFQEQNKTTMNVYRPMPIYQPTLNIAPS